MKTWLAFLLFLIFIGDAVSFGAEEVEWKNFVFPRGKAAIDMQGAPEPIALKVHLKKLDTNTILYGADSGEFSFFVFSYEVPKDDKTAIEEELTRCLENTKGEVVTRKEVKGAGYEGIEVVARPAAQKEVSILCRILRSKNTVYNLTMISTSPLDERVTAAERRFFDSFVVK